MRYGLVFAVGVVVFGADVAAAQPPRAGTNPQFSPYLNLLRRGNSPALNYYGLVRPELRGLQSLQSLQSQVDTNRQAIGDAGNLAGAPPTDKTVSFMNTGGYFQNLNPATGGAGFGAGGGRPAMGGGAAAGRSPRR